MFLDLVFCFTESDVKIVLLGSSGSGKSSSGNTILGRDVFGKERIHDSKSAWRHDGVLEDKTITVVDTDYLFDMMCQFTVGAEAFHYLDVIKDQFLNLCAPNPHVFLAVVEAPYDLVGMIFSIKRVFGSEFLKHTLILITHGNMWGTNTEKLLEERPHLQELIRKYDVGCHVFNNEEREDRTQVMELMRKIQVLVQKNEGRCYTETIQDNGGKFTLLTYTWPIMLTRSRIDVCAFIFVPQI